ncbi:MAG: hypothetical protein K0S53_1708 [Bacteroidetes bacterium]|jgi:gliding motility-associated-like protein|nr:hypothetical protein [Bacteroidota bacterium]
MNKLLPFSFKRLCFLLILASGQLTMFSQISGTSLNCGVSSSQALTNSGFDGNDATTTAGSCGQCCYAGADLDGDGDAEVTFSVENAKWYKYCNPSSTTPVTIDFIVDEVNDNCNLQGAVFVTAGTSNSGSTDALDIDCSNQEYDEYGSNMNGNADGFSFTGITIPAGGCAWLMVDGYNGATCSAFTIETICPCTPPTTPVLGSSSPDCSGQTLNLTATTVSGAIYTWTGPNSFSSSSEDPSIPNVTTAASGTYSLYVTVSGCKSATVTIPVTINPTPTVTSASTIAICSGSAINYSITSSTSSTFQWQTTNNGSTTGESTTAQSGSVITNVIVSTATVPTTLIYTVTPTSAAGCVGAIKTVTVTVSPTPTITVNNATICSGTSTVLTASGGTTYSWTPNTNLSATTGATVTASPTTTTIYTVTETSSGCASFKTVTVTVNPTPTISVNSATLCSGSSTVLTASGGTTYSWTPNTNISATTGSVVTANPTTTIVYTVTGTSNGCSNSRTSTVTVNSIPTTTANTTGTISCSTPSVILNSTLGGLSYTWTAPSGGSVGSANTQSTTASAAAGTYTLFVRSSAGCTYSTTTSVTQNTVAPVVSAGSNQTLTCASVSVTLTGAITSPTNATVNWTGPNVCGTPTTAITSACGAGIYTITATNPSNGCTRTSTVTVSSSAGAPAVSNNPVTNSITCTNTLVTVSISTTVTPVTYSWTGTGIVGATNTSSITVSQGGTFQYTVTSGGCSTSNNQVVLQNTTIPTTSASTSGTVTCSTPTIALTSTLSGMNYTWTAPSGGTVGSANTQSTTVSGAGGTYSLLVVNPSNGCSFTTTTSVTQNTTVPTTSANTTGTLTCSTTTVALTSTLTGMNYTWTAPAGGSVGSANTQSTTASGIAGTYSLLVVNPSNGCSFNTTTSVTENITLPTTSAITNGTITCSTPTVALTSTLSGMNYTWTAPSGGTVGSANTQSTSASGAGGTYSLLVVNPSNGCSFNTTTSVTQNTTTPTTSANTTGTLTCSTTTVALTSTLTGMNYTWTAPAGGTVGSANTQSTTASGTGGTYSLVITDPSTGCTFSTTTAVTQNTVTFITVATTTGTLTCSTNTVTLNSSLAGVSYTWTAPPGGSVGSANTQSTSASGAAGIYSLTVVNPSNGCSFNTTTSVTQNITVPITSAGTTGTLTCSITTVALTSTLTGMNYTWTAPAGGSIGSANTESTTVSGSPGTYSLSVIDPSNGCSFNTTTPVTQNITIPAGVSAGSNQALGCGSATVAVLSGSVSTPSTATASWSGPSISGSPTSFTTSANGAGVYTLTVTDPSNGCTTSSLVTVSPNAGAPAVTVNPVTNTITCTNTMVAVGVSTTVSPVSYTWSGTGIVFGNGTGTITVSQGGIFNYTLTNLTNSCTASGNTVVVQNTTIPVTAAGATGTLTCATNTVALSSTLTGMNYTWTAPAGGTIGSANTQSTTASGAAGAYTLMVLDPSNNCTYTTSAAVSQNTAVPTTIASSTGTLTCITSTVALNSTLAGMNYTWTAPVDGSVSTSTAQATTASGTPGNYSLTVVDPNNGCTFLTTASVSQNTIVPTGVSAGPSQTLTCPTNSVTLTGSITTPTNPIINWAGPGICGNQTTIVTEACAAGDYTLTVTDPLNGCSTASMVTIAPNAGSPTVTISSSVLMIDCNNSTQSATVTSLPTSDVTYSWSPAPSSVLASGDVATFNTPNTYICTVTNTLSNCSASAQVDVIANTTPPVIAISNTQTLTCATPTAAITLTTTPTTGLTYTWISASAFSGQGNDTIVVNTVDVYSVTVMDAATGCTNTANTNVTQNIVAPVLSAGSNQTLSCSATSATLTGSISSPINAVVSWDAGVCGTQTTVVTEACAAGVYTLTATDPSNGCMASSTVTVFPNAGAPLATASATAFTIDCNNATQSVTVTSTPSTDVIFHWNNTPAFASTDSSMATFNTAGTYICIVTNTLSNCSTPVQVDVIANTTPPVIVISNTQTLTCATTAAVITLTTTPAIGLTYTWSSASAFSGQGNDTIVVNTVDVYSVIVMDAANGCTNTANTNVTQNIVAPVLSAGSNQTLSCSATSATLTGSISSPINAVVSWDAGVCGTQTTVVTQACAAGVYTLTGTDPSNGCVETSTVQVFPNAGAPLATASSTALTIDCNNATQSVTITSIPPTNVVYHWNNTPAFASADSSSATFNAGNTYICTLTNTITGCSTPVPVVVTADTARPVILITPTQTLTCAPPTATISVATNSTTGLSYVWTGTLISGQGNDSVIVNQAGIYNVTVTNTLTGCVRTSSTQVVPGAGNPTVTITATSTNSMITCSNPTVTLLAMPNPSGTYSYTWSPSGNTAGAIEPATSIGVYNVVILDVATGCTATATTPYTVTANVATPTVSVSNALIACGTNSVVIGGAAISTATNSLYNWTSSAGPILGGTTSTPTVSSTGQYVVTVIDFDNGCTGTETVVVTQNNVTAAFTANPVSGLAPLGVGFTNQSTGASNYSWNFGDVTSLDNTSGLTDPSHVFNQLGIYTVTLTASNGSCTSTATISIEVLENSTLIVPNVFTPNGDGSNDLFKITSTGIEELNCDIFNRWGLKLYTIKSVNDSWDGGGNSAGTYFFILTAKGYDGKELKQEGFISLFK